MTTPAGSASLGAHQAAILAFVVSIAAAFAACSSRGSALPASAEPRGSIPGPAPTDAASLPPPPSIDPAIVLIDATPPADGPPAGTPPAPPDQFVMHADPELEARLPDRVLEIVLSHFSLGASDFGPDGRPAIDTLLRGLGKTTDDFTFAGARDHTDVLGGWIDAYRVAGESGAAVRDGLIGLVRARAGDHLTATETKLAGRDVTMLTFGPDAPADLAGLPAQFLYADADVAFAIYGSEATASALLGGIE